MKGKKIKKGQKNPGSIFVNKNIDLVDSRTGEVIEKTFVVFHKEVDELPFAKIYPALTQKIIEDLKANRIDGAINLLFYIANQIIENNMNSTEVFLSPALIAKEIKHTEQSIRRWLKILIKLGYIKKHPRLKPHWYIFNPYFLWRGNMRLAIRDQLWEEACMAEALLFKKKENKNDLQRKSAATK